MSAFPNVKKVVYEGAESTNPLAYRFYNAEQKVEGKTMKDHFRFSAAYWHTMRAGGSDPFGSATMVRPWEGNVDNVKNAQKRVKVFFEFLEKMQLPYYCFHDRDIAPEGKTLAESNANLDEVVKVFKDEQARTGAKLLWGTANLFGNPRYMHGAATSCNADVFAYAAAQVKKAMEITKELGGQGYTFWGGREGYQCIWNTNMKRELDNLARFMHMAVDYAKAIGFKGQFYFEPKPKEPTKHQYDFDAAACINFLRAYGLEKNIKLNIETNHATLAGHSVEHELEYAAHQGFLGSVDANTGDTLLGWDTDQFPTNVYETTKMMLVILKYGGFKTGGLNFDAKVRRESFEPIDLFYAHIGGVDAFAKGLLIAAEMRKSKELEKMTKERYSSWDNGIGAEIESGKHDFKSLEKYILKKGEIEPNNSGRQELFENIVNRYTF
ncbi:MAG: xylose isomerase [Planctomycetaceae bacterium]|jgi:xylose isomerase|nr:xylose isomerase [Planctomycetaceae bacterium]